MRKIPEPRYVLGREGGRRRRCRRKGKDVHFLRIFVLFIRPLSPPLPGKQKTVHNGEAPHTRKVHETSNNRGWDRSYAADHATDIYVLYISFATRGIQDKYQV